MARQASSGGPGYGESGEESSRSRGWTIVAGGTLVLVACMGAFLVTSPAKNAPRGSGQPRAAASPGTRVAAAPAGPCPASAVVVDPNPEPKSQWTLIGTMAAPSDATNGPKSKDHGYRVCFAHSTVGALYAATEFLATGTSDLRGPRAIREYFVDTPDRATAEQDPTASDRLDADGAIQVRGFQIESAARNRAVVGLAIGVDGTPTYVHLVLAMRWDNGDWKIVPPPTGELDGGNLDSLAGFTPWSGA